jgi:hypothetical protein
MASLSYDVVIHAKISLSNLHGKAGFELPASRILKIPLLLTYKQHQSF